MSTTVDLATASGFAPPTASLEQRKRADAETPPAGRTGGSRKHIATRARLPRYNHALAAHATPITSCLTKGSENSVSFVGFKNLMILVLIFSNLRLMLENFKKYGVLICVRCHDFRDTDLFFGGLLFFLVPCHLFVAYLIEIVAAYQVRSAVGRSKKRQSSPAVNGSLKQEGEPIHSAWTMIALAHGLNASLNLAMATFVVYYLIHHPGIGTVCELHAIIVWLKVCSYALTNRDLRHALLEGGTSELPDLYKPCPYPTNISISNLCYFWWAPTLLYQPVYPRSPKIRWGFAAKRLAETIGLSIAIWIASAQYAVPLLRNSLPIISELDLPAIFERVMKLSSISLFCWLAGFFAIFQSYLNFVAELLRFADRSFYLDWWNSPNIKTYWSSWNRPVYQFMKRHISRPLLTRGWSPLQAQTIIFTFSAILHEMAVGVPTHNIIGVAFAGMMFQLPLILLTDKLQRMPGLDSPTFGNIIFWVTFVLVGQPLAALLYFFAWQAKYGSATAPHLQAFWQ